MLLLALPGCDSGKAGDTEPAGEAAPSAPAELPSSVTSTPEKIAEGKEIFETRCHSCHGLDGMGKMGLGPAVASETFLAAATDEMLLTTVAKGRAGSTMIPWEGAMTVPQIEAVVVYLRSMTPHEAAELDESPLKGSVEAGEKTYRAICGTCHGHSGAGYSEAGSGTGIGRKAFLDTASDGYIRYLVNHGKSGTQMKTFAAKAPTAVANLSPEEIDGVIAYLRSKAW
jgi:mono/diheme cytochrome c family protein